MPFARIWLTLLAAALSTTGCSTATVRTAPGALDQLTADHGLLVLRALDLGKGMPLSHAHFRRADDRRMHGETSLYPTFQVIDRATVTGHG